MFNTKRKYFKDKLKAVEKMTWDLEFSRQKKQDQRESYRLSYDNLRNKLEQLNIKVKKESEPGGWKETKPDEFARFADDEAILKAEIEKQKSWIDGLDLEVVGSPITAQYPDGVQGVNQQLDALRDLQETLKQYIKGL